jgi:hypothetical protein
VLGGGRERSGREISALCEEAGLAVRQVVDVPVSFWPGYGGIEVVRA